jgi:hypothetical protein
MDIVTALLRSILDVGDGESQATAFEPIDPREEWIVRSAMGLPCSGDNASFRAIAGGGHRYHRWEVVNPKTHQNVVVFFNIDAFQPPN